MSLPRIFSITLASAVFFGSAASQTCETALPSPAPRSGDWQLVWREDFRGADLDRARWNIDQGDGGWGNRELQTYTDSPQNVRVARGKLLITAQAGPAGYTSARLNTRQKLHIRNGRVEARIRLPIGQGIWPAFWLMSVDRRSLTDDRPCAELDIMENLGSEPNKIHATVHTPEKKISFEHALPKHGRFADRFHIFAVEWDSERVRFFVDGKQRGQVPIDQLPPAFLNREFFLVLNVAVGGDWPGSPAPTTRFPQTMQVDWVRVWRRG